MGAFYETTKKTLNCKLTEEERRDRAMACSGVVAVLKETKAKNDAAKAAMKREETKLENEIAGLSDVVERGHELRQVECRWEYVINGPKDSVARLIRLDTEVEVEHHVMDADELEEIRQLDLERQAQPEVPTSIDDPTIPSADELHALMRKHNGNTTAAATGKGVSRRTLNRWLDARQVDAGVYRENAKATATA
jgi:hypothetical protein